MIRTGTGRPNQSRLRRLGSTVLVLAGCCAALSACGVPLIPVLPSATPTVAPTASRAPTPPGEPSSAPTGPASPTPSDQPGVAAPCSADELTFALQARPGDSGAGSFFWDLSVTNAGAGACSIDGYPSVTLVSADTGQPVGAASGLEPRATPVELLLDPGDSAYSLLHLTQAGAYGCPLVPVTRLEVTLPADAGSSAVATPDAIQGCDDPAVQLVRTGAFAPTPVVF
ncbi:DUF4232 domain-containing protein [Cryobacterium sp. SO2]|uniref:DUF4232 domain-containing protein n=1 Tax=Cryobacterium sp. SO2 TaxID=1897060 RepID=UPI00223D06D9|nr:DUF4232 domain-containing protein [Cryobacterium sp. SO2]WEO77430.1 DUF4232 domain-containing protein [Cryobacterium sp. SO2]